MTQLPGYIRLNAVDAPQTDDAGRVLGDVSHVHRNLAPKKGVSTVVIPPFTEGGTPEGFDPGMTNDVVINYDPGRPQAVSFSVADLIQRQTEGTRGAVVTHNTVKAGAVIATAPTTRAVEMQPQAQVLDNVYPAYNAQPVMAPPQHIPGLRPLEVLQQAAAAKQQPVPQQLHVPVATGKIVTFDVSGIGTFQAPYADVIRQGDLLILVFDHANSGQMCYFPDFGTTMNDDALPMVALRVDGTRTVHMVETTGVRFRHMTLEYCVLYITQSADGDG